MPYIYSLFRSISAVAALFGIFANVQAFYGNTTTSSNSPITPDSVSNEMPVITDAVTIMLQEPPPPPPPSAAPGETLPSILAPLTAAPSPTEPGSVDQPLPGILSAAPSPTDAGDPHDCSRCSIYFQYVNVYYWPATSSNTDCLSIVSSKSLPPLPPEQEIVFPSVYVVFPTISAGNSCTQVGRSYNEIIMSFAPGELSTIEGPGGPTKAFDFADLPCPPPAIAAANSYFYNPEANRERAYSPMIDLPRAVLELDPAFRSCVAAVYQGFDPPTALQRTNGLTPPRTQFGPPHRQRARALAHPHLHPHVTLRPPVRMARATGHDPAPS